MAGRTRYDANGNRLEYRIQDSSTRVYGYNAEDQLTLTQQHTADDPLTPLVWEVTQTYDAFGNRIGRSENRYLDEHGDPVSLSSEERYAIDAWQTHQDFWGNAPEFVGNENANVWADLDAEGNLVARRFYGNGIDQSEATVRGDAVTWSIDDRQGSIIAGTDAAGDVTATAGYSAAGVLLTGSTPDRYGYAGREYDDLAGLYYNRARWYDPSTARFTTEDPMDIEAGDPNFYRYVGNSPTNGTDPSGYYLQSFDAQGAQKLFDYITQLNRTVNPGSSDPVMNIEHRQSGDLVLDESGRAAVQNLIDSGKLAPGVADALKIAIDADSPYAVKFEPDNTISIAARYKDVLGLHVPMGVSQGWLSYVPGLTAGQRAIIQFDRGDTLSASGNMIWSAVEGGSAVFLVRDVYHLGTAGVKGAWAALTKPQATFAAAKQAVGNVVAATTNPGATIRAVGNAIVAKAASIGEAASELGGTLKSAGKKLLDSAKSLWNKARNALSELWDAATNTKRAQIIVKAHVPTAAAEDVAVLTRAGSGADAANAAKTAIEKTGCFVAGTPTWVCVPQYAAAGNYRQDSSQNGSALATVPIERIELGQRVPALNPLIEQRYDVALQPDCTGWKVVRLEVRHRNGSIVDVELLRSVEWLELYGIRVGARIDLRWTELETDGTALVRAIESGPEVMPGEGAVVIGRFVTRRGGDLIRVTFEGGTQIVGTKNHLAWSPLHWDWRPLGEFAIGQFAQSRSGPVAVVAIEELTDTPTLYNIEVQSEHAYEVGDAGILVHNNGICQELLELRDLVAKGQKLNPAQEARKAVLEAQALADGVVVSAPKTGLPATSEASVVDKLERYLLNAEHPVGRPKAKWFEQALGFTKDKLGDLAKQIKFDPAKAVQTGVTEHGTKFNQVIEIIGANGKKIEVTFAWIKNNDGVVRLVTAIPTPK